MARKHATERRQNTRSQLRRLEALTDTTGIYTPVRLANLEFQLPRNWTRLDEDARTTTHAGTIGRLADDLAQEFALYRQRTKRHDGFLFASPVRRGQRVSYAAVVEGEWAKSRKDGSFSTLNMGRFEKAVFYCYRTS